MPVWRKTVLFYLGGTVYMTLEYLWRGRSHGSMFLLGGTCFSLLGPLGKGKIPSAAKPFLGAGVITALELAAGLAVNRDYAVWDYRRTPLNYRGQICLPYALLWSLLSIPAMELYRAAERGLTFGAGKVK